LLSAGEVFESGQAAVAARGDLSRADFALDYRELSRDYVSFAYARWNLDMSAEVKKEIQLEIAHVLFMDIVGYSKRLINEQRALRETLNQVVRNTEQFRDADATGTLIKSPTGDGMALVFRRS